MPNAHTLHRHTRRHSYRQTHTLRHTHRECRTIQIQTQTIPSEGWSRICLAVTMAIVCREKAKIISYTAHSTHTHTHTRARKETSIQSYTHAHIVKRTDTRTPNDSGNSPPALFGLTRVRRDAFRFDGTHAHAHAHTHRRTYTHVHRVGGTVEPKSLNTTPNLTTNIANQSTRTTHIALVSSGLCESVCA